MVAEEVLVQVATERATAAARNFKATCGEHGDFIWQNCGHHSTQVKRQMRDQFSTGERDTIRERLGPEERELFDNALAGWYVPTDAELKCWLAIVRREA